MTFEDREKSWEDGAPVEYYEFIKDTVFHRYNTSDRVLQLNGHDFLPLSITRDRIQQGAERNKLTMSVEVPRSAAVFDWWHPYPVSSSVGLTIYSGHIGELDHAVCWIGRVVTPKFKPKSVILLCEPSTTTSRKTGQVQCWQRNCMHVLYKQGDGLCNANKDAFKVEAVIATSFVNVVTAPEFAAVPSGRLAGGYVEWEAADGTPERRSISAHSGTSITLFYGTSLLPVGTIVTAYPGCRRTWDDCDGFFDNGDNYGGDLFAPERSPFNGQPVY